jgi:YHS domain-containing protein
MEVALNIGRQQMPHTQRQKEKSMKHMRKTICLLAFMAFAVGSLAVTVPLALGANSQEKCPVLGNPINKNVYTDYEGKRIYFCCAGCPQEFKKDPAKYMKKLEEQGVVPEAAPKS